MARSVVAAAVVVAMALGAVGTVSPAQAASSSSKTEQTAATDVTFSLEMDCVACHRAADKDRLNEDCLLSSHEAVDCVNCHSNEKALEKRHAKMATKDPNGVKRLSAKNRIAAETCEACHKAEVLEKATEKSVVLTDKNGLSVNPHDLPEGHFGENVTCTDCHSMHDDEAVLADEAAEACASCHHTDVYECYTCHA